MSSYQYVRGLMRRTSDRIPLEALCTEYDGNTERHAMVVDLSEKGLKVMRPYCGSTTSRIVQLELELPGIDEIVWAKGEICFDQLWKVGPAMPRAGLAGWLRASGIRIVAAARRDLALMRDYVHILQKEVLEEVEDDAWYVRSTAFARG
jgi:hypothetical protein